MPSVEDDLIALMAPRLLPLNAAAIKVLLPAYSDSQIGDGLKGLVNRDRAWRYAETIKERFSAAKATSDNLTHVAINEISQDGNTGTFPLDLEVTQVPEVTWSKPTNDTHLTITGINNVTASGNAIPLAVDVVPPLTDGLYWMDRSSSHSATIQTQPPQSVALDFHVRLILTVTTPTILQRITLGILNESENANHGDTTYAGISQMAATLPLAAYIGNTLLIPTVPETDDGTGNPPPGLSIDGQATLYGTALYTLTPGSWAVDVYVPTFNIPPATQCRLGIYLSDPQGVSAGTPNWTINIGATSPPQPNYSGPQPLQPSYGLSWDSGPATPLPIWTAGQQVNLPSTGTHGTPTVILGATPPPADAMDPVSVTLAYLKRYRYRYSGQFEAAPAHAWSSATTSVNGLGAGTLTYTPETSEPSLNLGTYRDDITVSRKRMVAPPHAIDQIVVPGIAQSLAYKLIPTTRP